MRLLVRTWNVFHGRTSPPTQGAHLERMVRLVSEDGPDALCLQEIPVWALCDLGGWSGMRVFGALATRPLVRGSAGRRITELEPRLFRSALWGQANAILVSERLHPEFETGFVLNPRCFRRSEARRLRLPLWTSRAWAWNRRMLHAVRIRDTVVANLHATRHTDRRLAAAELERAAERMSVNERCILCGDFNVGDLALPGFSDAGPGIDHIVVRGVTLVRGPERWPDERRVIDGVLLSDHAPVEAEMIVG